LHPAIARLIVFLFNQPTSSMAEHDQSDYIDLGKRMDTPYTGPDDGRGISEHNLVSVEDLRSAKEFAEMIVDTIWEGLLVLDFDLRVQAANESFYQMFDVSREETEGRLVFDLGNGQWNIPELRTLLERLLPEKTVVTDYVVEHHFQAIGRRVVRLNARQLNHHQKILLAVEDITDQKQTEEALREVNAQLESRIAERTRELEQRNHTLQNFVFAASHDLQEPLRKVQTFANLIQTDYGDTLDPDVQQYLDRIEKAASRMSLLLSDLLAYSRIHTQTKTRQLVRVEGLIMDVLSDLDMIIEQSGAQVDVKVDVTIEVDPDQFRQILNHLVLNAIKFQIPESRPHIHITAPREADADGLGVCRIVVSDNGIGFDMKYAEKIFEPFQRLHGRHSYPGTGMGLAICQRIVERHQGTIRAESIPGKGSRFIVELPASVVETPPATA
jgi:two-component system CheB/CheR fusion protein